MNLTRAFTEHPASVGETYGSHLLHAMGFGSRLMMAGMACVVHALVPFAFISTGSRTVTQLYDRMVVSRSSVAAKTSEVVKLI